MMATEPTTESLPISTTNLASTTWSNGSKKRTKLARIEERADSEAREAAGKREKTVTFADKPVQDTPLMFSRCSSLGSLESFDCDVNSVHSSVISDYSRRTSAAVSPTELPDSPCDSPPHPETATTISSSAATPAVNHQKRASPPPGLLNSVPVLHDESTYFRAASDEDAHCGVEDCDSGHHKILFATEGTPCHFSAKSSLSALSFGGDAEPNVVVSTANMQALDCSSLDRGRVFATEDTPCVFSAKSSLSAFSFSEKGELSTATAKVEMVVNNHDNPLGNGCHSNSTRSSSSSDGVSEEMLAECIKSALPTPEKRKGPAAVRKSTSDSNLQSRLPRPVQLQPPPEVVAVAAEETASVNTSPRLSLGKHSVCGSDTSSLTEESSDLLCEVIQSAMPKARPRHRKPTASTTAVPTTASSGITSTWDGVDSPRVYQVEGTPFAHSRRDSLSSPSLDGDENCSPPSPDKRAAFQRGLVRLAREGRMSNAARISGIHQRLTGGGVSQTRSTALSSGLATPAPRIFATEDTPAELSYNSPLSSLHTSGCHSPMPGGTGSHDVVNNGSGNHRVVEPDASSLSSVSVASGDHNLLEACINSAMPQPRPRSAPAKERHRIVVHSPSAQQLPRPAHHVRFKLRSCACACLTGRFHQIAVPCTLKQQ